MISIHATCIAFDRMGVLLRGPSGSGKSDLALRALPHGARMVADDRVELEREGDDLFASAPTELFGMMEVRGIGVVKVDALERARVALVVDLVDPDAVERMPERTVCGFEGVSLPLFKLAPFEGSAVAKLMHALEVTLEPGRLVQ
jgi:serine kinase of HPr protein (carbohydrate metabolism regulator)